jgi:hypothetical protein
VDLLCLYRDHVTPYVKAVAERLQTWLWDAQVTLGGAVRTLADTIQLARGDATVATALLAPRFLAGSGILFHQFTRMVQDRLLDRPEAFITGLIGAMQQRHTRYGDSLYLLQPNVKEGAGGCATTTRPGGRCRRRCRARAAAATSCTRACSRTRRWQGMVRSRSTSCGACATRCTCTRAASTTR